MANVTLCGEVQKWMAEFLKRKEFGDECIKWPFSTGANGYGMLRHEGGKIGAHRLVLKEISGPPESMDLHAAHSCNNRICVNPNHLSWKTLAENCEDRDSKLSREDVRAIFFDERKNPVIAREYGLHSAYVSRIKTGKRWGWYTRTLSA